MDQIADIFTKGQLWASHSQLPQTHGLSCKPEFDGEHQANKISTSTDVDKENLSMINSRLSSYTITPAS